MNIQAMHANAKIISGKANKHTNAKIRVGILPSPEPIHEITYSGTNKTRFIKIMVSIDSPMYQ
jgi:hypothetical protein